MEDDMKVLWEHDGFRLVRFGEEGDSITVFESAFYEPQDGEMKIIGWNEAGASQVGGLLDALGEWFDFKDRGLEKFEIRRMALSG